MRSPSLDDKLGRFYVTWRSSALAMLVRAFGSQLDEHSREDIYSNAWAASLASLGDRIGGMSDAELRKYVFAAVTTHAGKELRRRKRKPIDPLGDVEPAAVGIDAPGDEVVRREDAYVLRDVLASLPERRRKVLTLRYGLGLSPDEICAAIEGLSMRAYRKELTRAIKEMAARLDLIESGDWCDSLGDQISAFARGEASQTDEIRAKAHLAHCLPCAKAVKLLAGSLNDLSVLPVAGLLAGADAAGANITEHGTGLVTRVKESAVSLLSRSAEGDGAISSIAAAGGTRGTGSAVLAGIGAKLGALGAAGKVAVGCIGASAGLATCVAAGVVPATAVNDLLPNPRHGTEGRADEGSHAAEGTAGISHLLEPAPETQTPGTIQEGNSGERNSPGTSAGESADPAEPVNDSPAAGPAIAPQTVAPPEAEASPEVAAAAAASSDGAGSERPKAAAPKQAGASDATAQLGTP